MCSAVLQPVGAEAAADIEKDLDRTFPRTRRFAAAEGQEALRRVLMAYAAFDPEVRVHCCLRAHVHACVCAVCQPVTTPPTSTYMSEQHQQQQQQGRQTSLKAACCSPL